MKNFNFIKISICALLSFFMFAMFSVVSLNVNNKSYADINDINPRNSESTTISHSLFIHSPTYSVLYQDNIYFIDEYDSLIKIYNKNNSVFNDKYIDLSELGEIIDVDYLDEYMFILSKNQETSNALKLTLIDLPDILISKTIELELDSVNYEKLSVCDIQTDWLIALTPNVESDETIPVILTLNKTPLEITKVCELDILDDEISSKLFEITVIESTGTTSNEIYMVLVYGSEISFFGTTIDTVKTSNTIQINTGNRSFKSDLDTTNSNISFAAVNKILINNELLFLITYNKNQTTDGENSSSSYSRLYKFEIDVSDDKQYFTSQLEIQTLSSKYVMTSNSCVVYPIVDSQQITYTTLTYSHYDEDNKQHIYVDNSAGNPISNPNVDEIFRDEKDFEFVTANKKTYLLSTPWESEKNSKLEIDPSIEPVDLIIIGEGKISSQNLLIEDYKYCLITTASENIEGYVKTEDLSPKQKITMIDSGLNKYIKVHPETKLYSLPTTIINDNITPTLSSYIVTLINTNSKVEIIEDYLYNYKANENLMLKVRVNDIYEGYIIADKIINPSGIVNYIITNASIKRDNTNVYMEANSSSQIIWILNKGYKVRIDGARNTETGYTKITFNDEYGNEKTGYILTDTIDTDNWTTMQIIGCVLIAVNIGLLILILRFKKNSIGPSGSKYLETENKHMSKKKNIKTKNEEIKEKRA